MNRSMLVKWLVLNTSLGSSFVVFPSAVSFFTPNTIFSFTNYHCMSIVTYTVHSAHLTRCLDGLHVIFMDSENAVASVCLCVLSIP